MPESVMHDARVVLRAPEPDDLDLLYAWENDASAWRNGANHAPLSRDLLNRYLLTYEADVYRTGELRLVIADKATGNAAGSLELFDFDVANRRTGLGIYIAPDCRRRGLALHALGVACGYAHGVLGCHQVWATVAADNPASIALFRKAGFISAGRLRSWLRRGPRAYVDAYTFQHLAP